MFYFTTFILALVTWTQQQNGSFSLSPYTTYTPPSQHHHISKEKVTHGVNIYLCEQFQDPITPSINIYYWLRNKLNTCKKLTIKDRSKQQLILLLLSGIEPNPGPRRPRFPCTICQKSCKTDSIACDDCDKWTHRQCIGMSTTEFSKL